MNEYHLDLVKYRLEKAHSKLHSAQLLFQEELFEDSLSRSYYAMFTAAKAIPALKKLDSRKHSGIISLFNQHFVKSNIVDKSPGRILMNSKDFREESDYGDYVSISKEDAHAQFSNAEFFISNIEQAIENIKQSNH